MIDEHIDRYGTLMKIYKKEYEDPDWSGSPFTWVIDRTFQGVLSLITASEGVELQKETITASHKIYARKGTFTSDDLGKKIYVDYKFYDIEYLELQSNLYPTTINHDKVYTNFIDSGIDEEFTASEIMEDFIHYSLDFGREIIGFTIDDIEFTGTLADDSRVASLFTLDNQIYTMLLAVPKNQSGSLTITINNDITDIYGNSFAGFTSEVLAIVVNPTAIITRSDNYSNNLSQVTFNVLFDKEVILAEENIALGGTNSSNCSINSIVSNNNIDYNIIVDVAEESGGTLNIIIDNLVLDLNGNAYAGGSSLFYDLDRIIPTATIIQTDSLYNKLQIVNFTINFSEVVTGFTLDKISLIGTLSSNCTINSLNTIDSDTYVLSINVPSLSNGTIGFSIASVGILDSFGNVFQGEISDLYYVNRNNLTCDITLTDSTPTKENQINYNISFSEDVVNFDSSDIVLTGNLDFNIVELTNVNNKDFTLTLESLETEIEGNIGFDIGTGFSDIYGNLSLGYSSEFYVIDKKKPTATINLIDDITNNLSTVSFDVVFNEEITGFTSDDISFLGTLTGNVSLFDTNDNITFNVDVTISEGSTGTLGIRIGDQIFDLLGNQFEGLDSDLYNINTIVPTATITLLETNPLQIESASFEVEFSEEVFGFTIDDITLGGTLAGTSSINSLVDEGSNIYTVYCTIPNTVNGTLNIIIGTGITNLAGNNFEGLTSGNYLVSNISPTNYYPLGANLGAPRDYSYDNIFADIVKSARIPNNVPDTAPATVDTNGFPTEDCNIILLYDQFVYDITGTYKLYLTCNVQPTLSLPLTDGSITNIIYDSESGEYTCDVNVFSGTRIKLRIENVGTGITNLEVYRPNHERGTLFTTWFIEHVSRFKVIRFMDFNDTNNHSNGIWANRSKITQFTQAKTPNGDALVGVCYEYMIELCNMIQADMWVNVPYPANDEYIINLANLIKNTLHPDLNVYFEYSNETWNYQFTQTQDLQIEANTEPLLTELSWDGETNEYYMGWRLTGKRTLNMSNICKNVFGEQEFGNKFKIVLNCQIGRQKFGTEAMKYILQYGSGTQVSDHVNYLGVAPYYNMGENQVLEGLTVDQIIASLDDSITLMINNVDVFMREMYGTWNMKTITYEGGTDTFGLGSIANKRLAQFDPRHKAMVERYLNGYYDKALEIQGEESLFMWYFAGGYRYDHPYGYGTWGLLEDPTGSTPKLEGINQIIEDRFAGVTTIPVSLSYSSNPVKAGVLTITATYSEAVTTIPKISINQQGSFDITNANMTDSGDMTVFTYQYTVNAKDGVNYIDGVAIVSLSQVANDVGDISASPSNNSFTIDTTKPTALITQDDPVTNALTQVSYSILFSESVIGFTVNDIVLNGSLVGTATINSLTNVGNLYTLLIDINDSIGTIGFSIGSGVLTDLAGNTYNGDISEQYTIIAVAEILIEGIGSSVLLGTGATDNYGWLNQIADQNYNGRDISVINEGIGATTTGYWLANYNSITNGNGTDYDTTIIGLALGNESGTSQEKVTTYQTNYPQLISLIRSGKANYVVAQGNYVRAGQDYDERWAVDEWLEGQNLDCLFSAENLDDTLGSIIDLLDSGDGVHPNEVGHSYLRSAINLSILDNITSVNTFNFQNLPTKPLNTNKAYLKSDKLTVNPFVINIEQFMYAWTLSLELKSLGASQNNVILSVDQGLYTLKMFVDTDNDIKITDGITTITTGINITTFQTWKTYTLRFNGAHSLKIYIDGILANTISYTELQLITETGRFIIGGLFDDNTNDIESLKFRNIRLWRASIYPDAILKDSNGTRSMKRSQEAWFECTSLVDMTNKSQTDATFILNDSNIVIDEDPILSTLVLNMPLDSDFSDTGSKEYSIINNGAIFSGADIVFNGTNWFEVDSMILENNFTIEFDWLYSATFGTYDIFGKSGLTNGSSWLNVQRTGGATHKWLYNETSGLNLDVPDINVSPYDTWYKIRLLVTNKDGALLTMRYYINEVLNDTLVLNDRYFNDDGSGSNWSFGNCLGVTVGNNFLGKMKNLKIWSEAYDIGEEPAEGIDTTSPDVVLSYSSNPVKAGVLTITATYSEVITTTPNISIDQQGTIDISSVAMTSLGDNKTFTYQYTVNADNGSTYVDGLASITLSQTEDSAGNISNAPSNSTFTIDTIKPFATIELEADTTINLDQAIFTVTFDEPIFNFNLSDIEINSDSQDIIDNSSVDSITNISGNIYEVVVNVAPSNALGSLGITLLANGVTDQAGNGNIETVSSTYSVDKNKPTAIITLEYQIINNLSIVEYTVVFNKPVTGFTTDDITINGIGILNSLVANSSTNYTVLVDIAEVNGGSGITIGTGIVDDFGNSFAGLVSDIYTIDNTSPDVAITYSSNPANAGALTITATYSEEITTIPNISIDQQGSTDISSVAMTDSGDMTVFTYIYTVNEANGSEYIDGIATVSLSATEDIAGNISNAPTNNTFEIETTTINPNLLIDMPLTNDFTNNGTGEYTPINTGVTFNGSEAIFDGSSYFEIPSLVLGEELAIEFDWLRNAGFSTWHIFGKAGLTNGSADMNIQRTGGSTHKWLFNSTSGLNIPLLASLSDLTWYKIRLVVTALDTSVLTIRYYIDDVFQEDLFLNDRFFNDDGTGTNWSFGTCFGASAGAIHSGKMKNLKVWSVAYQPGQE